MTLKEDGYVSITIYNKEELIAEITKDELVKKDILKEYVIDKAEYNLDEYDVRNINIRININ